MRCRMVIFSGPMRMSLTSSRRTRWRSSTVAVAAVPGRRVGEQGGDVVPHDGVEVVGADRLVAANPAAFVAVVIAAQAPVVVDLPAGGACRGAVVPVAAGRAGGQALQQGRDLGVAGGEPLVVFQPLPDAGEGVLVHD